jgi:hypothetical protein
MPDPRDVRRRERRLAVPKPGLAAPETETRRPRLGVLETETRRAESEESVRWNRDSMCWQPGLAVTGTETRRAGNRDSP